MDFKKTRDSLMGGLDQVKNEMRRHEEALSVLRIRMHQNEGALMLLDSLEEAEKAAPPGGMPSLLPDDNNTDVNIEDLTDFHPE